MTNTMKKTPLLFVPLLMAAFVLSCSKQPATDNAAAPAADTTVYPVKTQVLEMKKIDQQIEYTANLLPNEEINFAPASPGRIEQMLVEVGSRVSKGDVIAIMDKTQLQQATEQYQNAKSTFQRMDTLRKLNSVSEQAYDGAKTQYEVSKASYDFMKKNTTLVSPINGIVTGKYFESGELYSGAPNTSAGKAAVVTLMQINPLKVTVNLSERYFPVVRKGMKATIGVDIIQGKTFPGEISKIYPTINADSRTFPVEIMIRNEREILRPGMFARVTLNLGETEALLLPAVAVVKQEGTNDRYVFITGSDNVARKIRVKIGERFDDQMEIISDSIKVGTTVIVAGQENLLDQSKITVVK
jgi:membrane fusion protein, multidrug efflux system